MVVCVSFQLWSTYSHFVPFRGKDFENTTAFSSALTTVGPLGSDGKYWPEAGPSDFYTAFGVLNLSDI